MGLEFGQVHVGRDVNAGHGESVDLGVKTAAGIHEGAAETRLLHQAEVSSRNGGSISEGIPKSPNRPPQSLLQGTSAFGDLTPSQVVRCTR
jgi:hypothetical protein